MKTIKPFIDLGWHTVPLKGKLKRLEDGSKTVPEFPKDWKHTYQNEFNEKETAIGGAVTGSVSGIIALDCDNQAVYNMFTALDLNNEFHFISKNKPKGGGTIIYKYSDAIDIPTFSINTKVMNFDFYSDNGFIYLPTDENTTKESWSVEDFNEFPEIPEAPTEVLLLLQTLYAQYSAVKGEPAKNDSPKVALNKANYLAPQIELLIAKKTFIPSLFRVITPRDFRDLKQYTKLGYLHPNEVPEGRGSEYLMKVSAILGADPSIDASMYTEAMQIINQLWENPIKTSRLNQTIINPMVEGRASINGETIWVYDEHWKSRGFAFTNKLGEAVEAFFDADRATFYLINYTKNWVKQFYRDTDLYSYIETVAIGAPSRKEMKPMLPIVPAVINPALPFGFYSEDEYNRKFNTFQQSPALAILNNPSSYEEYYTRPVTILNFLKSLVPDDYMRNYLLQFLRMKLTTFRYSPVVLYFLGTHGSGKDTLVNIIAEILGDAYVARPTTKEFLEQFNGWLVDKYFVQLDEYGNQLTTQSAKAEALGKIKAYTGKQVVQIRQMRTDGYQHHHSATFIMTANTNPLMLEENDRRMALFETPNVLKDESWVQETGGI
ncbi:MAG: DUF5906 domain-containing protein, partial [Gammaproteobacteria bacterium]|nr:DUF5906 domain-containing protein [Gammaproteobacteria bacterium]